jgi:cytochrome P450
MNLREKTAPRASLNPFASFGIDKVRQIQRDPLGLMMSMHKEGGMVPFRMAGRSFVYLGDPEDVEWMFRQRADVLEKDAFTHELGRLLGKGLLVSEGEFWRRQRGLMAHAFTPKRIRSYGESMAVIAERFADTLEDGEVVDIHRSMNRVTMAIVAKTLFDSDVSDRGLEVGHALEDVLEFFANSPEAVLRLPDWVPTPRLRRFVAGRRTIERVVDDIIRERRASGEDRGDLLSAMLASQHEDGKGMSDAQLRDECVTLFLAGHETTALLLAHAFVLLSQHPAVADRIREELEGELAGRAPTVDDMKRLPYTDQVIQEALRVYPSAWAVGREVVNEITLKGHRLAPGTQLMASQWAMHRDPRFFPNPEAFIPERWAGDAKRKLPRGAFFPFADGPRVCIGNHFALTEAFLVLVAIVRKWNLELLPGERLEFAPSVTLRTRRGVKMRVRAAREPAREATTLAATG